MDINNILKGIECTCGRHHMCDIENVYIENGAISRLADLCTAYDSILIVADENTFGAAGNKVKAALAHHNMTEVIFPGDSILIPNEDAIEKVSNNLGKTSLILGIGSGVVQDLCKYVSGVSKIPYMIVATAPSMDGYASDGAAMILAGMKETVKSGLPRAIIADTEVLKHAPMEMIKAGYGDIVGKFSALNDWKLSQCVNDEYFCDYIYNTTMDMVNSTLSTAKGLLKRDEQSIGTLMEALVTVGIMMSFAGSSRPASGSEHHLSHFFEIVGIVDDEPYFTHGIDVAYSTVVTAGIREEIMKKEFPEDVFRLSDEEYTGKMKTIYKSVGDGCIELQKRVGNYTNNRAMVYKAKEAEIKEILGAMPDAEEITAMLSMADIDMKDFYDLYSAEKIQTAIDYAKDLKDRYTVLWLNYDVGGV